MATRLTAGEARDILNACDAHGDYHALFNDAVEALAAVARSRGYRAPKNRNGSATRYFHAYLTRTARS